MKINQWKQGLITHMDIYLETRDLNVIARNLHIQKIVKTLCLKEDIHITIRREQDATSQGQESQE